MIRLCMSLLLILAVVTPLCGEEAAETAAETTVTATTSPERLVDNALLRACWSRDCQLRASRGLRPRLLNERLCAAAQDHANWMAANNSMQHYSNGGPTGRAFRYGFRRSVSENIAAGYGSVDAAFNGWVNSGGHYANMMGGTSSAGFGCATAANGTIYWCAVYGNSGAEADGDVVIAGDGPADTAQGELPVVQVEPVTLSTGTGTYASGGSTQRRRGLFWRFRR